jgi:Helix-turn-helix domain
LIVEDVRSTAMMRRLKCSPLAWVLGHDIWQGCSQSISAQRRPRSPKTTRVQRAKRLLDETDLPMTEIALKAGFRSLRRFNAIFIEVYDRSPTEIRRSRRPARQVS